MSAETVAQTLPQEPVRIFEGVSLIAEQVQEEVIARLGQISIDGSEAESIEWMNGLSDSVERVRAVTDLIFKAINDAHERLEATPEIEVVRESTVPEPEAVIPQPRLEMATKPEADAEELHLIHEMMTFALRNPGFRAEELKHGGNGFSAMSAADIRAARKLVVSHLAEHDVHAEWLTEGKTRGSRYTLLVHEGHDTIVQLLTPPDTIQNAEPEVAEVDTAPQPARSAEDYTVKEATLVELSLADIVASRPMQIKEVLFAKFGVPHLPPHAFQQFRQEIQQAIADGNIRKLQNGRLASMDFVESTQTAAEVEKMIKDLRRESGIQALVRKPKQRQRGRR